MGCDGGTIPRRDELVRVKKKAEVKDKESELNFQWRCCAITQQVLQEPIVTCHLGKLYNKLSLIEALLNKDTLPEGASHIKSLKDIVQLRLTKNPAYKEEKSGNTTNTSPYICPIIGLELSGKFRFVALWSCGCVFSERSLKEIATEVCHNCQKPFEETDVVILNPNEEDLAVMRKNMEMRQMARKKKDKSKAETKFNKSKVESTITKPSQIGSGASTSSVAAEKPGKSQVGTEKPGKGSIFGGSISNGKPSTSMIMKKRPGSLKEPDESAKKIKPDYSLSKDPNVSDVYKSIFTSHKSEQEQTRAHWVTYNPFYN